MKKQLLDVLFMSEKRKNVLLLLQDGMKETNTLLCSLETTRQALLPQIRILEESKLVDHRDDTYELTTIGQLVVEEMSALVDTVEVLDIDIAYWGERQLDFIPPDLFKRLNELGSCKVFIPDMTELHEINKEFFEKSKESRRVTKVITFLYPNFPSIYSEWIASGLYISLIISAELFEKIQEDNYEEFRGYLNSGKMELFVYSGEIKFLSFGYNDHCASFKLLRKTGDYDSKELLCCNPGAVKWCRELCEYYKAKSTPITDI
ncbi:winged helix-turn-helix domain-containing protein [Methanolobus sp. ZRKC2]|uniref:helix-turn-helix transcriptional regulator n=1 Tax=Methanolobus sp. ZRKC2 TaxID=3125783 RepID=UPI003252CD1C